jgi:hypothetical protein
LNHGSRGRLGNPVPRTLQFTSQVEYAKNAHKILDGLNENFLSMGFEQPQANKPAGSQVFHQTVANHDFIVKTTAPDYFSVKMDLVNIPNKC